MTCESEDVTQVDLAYSNSDLLEVSHEFIRTYIRHIDQKASILLTLMLAALGLFSNAVRTGAIQLGLGEMIFAGLATLCAGVSLAMATWVVYPRANLPDEAGYVYWEKILLFDDGDAMFAHAKDEIDEDAALQELTNDTYEISKIARNKYESLRWAVKISLIGGIFASVPLLANLIKELHQISPQFENQIVADDVALVVAIIFVIIFLIIMSGVISHFDDQIDGITGFWQGQLEQLMG